MYWTITTWVEIFDITTGKCNYCLRDKKEKFMNYGNLSLHQRCSFSLTASSATTPNEALYFSPEDLNKFFTI